MSIKIKSASVRNKPRQHSGSVRVPKFAPVTLSEHNGVRYLHFGSIWIQGAMRIRKPDWLELEYAQQMMTWMLFQQQPQHIVQLGLGAAALTKFCYRQFPDARITAIELNPAVIAVCSSMFTLPANDKRLSVMEMDAMHFVCDAGNVCTIDILQVDLYDATARGPMLDTPEFYAACALCLKDNGIMTVNLFGDHPSFAKNMKAIRLAFKDVWCLPEIHQGNIVVIAFKNTPDCDFPTLYARATEITHTTKLPAKSWVDGLKIWHISQHKATL